MPVSDFECQIARGQIGRYLDGGSLSTQSMTILEEHLAECPDCKDLVAERRAALMGALGGEVPTHAVVEMPIENPLIAALRAKATASVERKRSESPKPGPTKPAPAKAAPRYAKEASQKSLVKPLALAALLAAVLLGMSRVSTFLGTPLKRAAASFAAESLPAPKLVGTIGPTPSVAAEKPKTTEPKAILPASDSRESPKPEAAKPKPVVAKPVPLAKTVKATPKAPIKPRVRRPIKRKATVRRASKRAKGLPHAPKKPRSTVRVYGLDGRPLKP